MECGPVWGIIQKLQWDICHRVMWERHKFQRVTSVSFDGSLMSWWNKQWPPVLSSSLGSPGVGAARRPWNLHQLPIRFMPRCKCLSGSVGPMQKGWTGKHCCRASRKSKRWTWKRETFSPWQILLCAMAGRFPELQHRFAGNLCISSIRSVVSLEADWREAASFKGDSRLADLGDLCSCRGGIGSKSGYWPRYASWFKGKSTGYLWPGRKPLGNVDWKEVGGSRGGLQRCSVAAGRTYQLEAPLQDDMSLPSELESLVRRSCRYWMKIRYRKPPYMDSSMHISLSSKLAWRASEIARELSVAAGSSCLVRVLGAGLLEPRWGHGDGGRRCGRCGCRCASRSGWRCGWRCGKCGIVLVTGESDVVPGWWF